LALIRSLTLTPPLVAILSGSLLAFVPWVEAPPEDEAERALRDAVARGAFGGAPAAAETLRRVSEAHPGTTASGLARLAAGLNLVEAGRSAEALAHLTHADVARTELSDHAFAALGRAQEALSDYARAAESYERAAAVAKGPVLCPALLRGAEAHVRAARPDRAIAALERALASCRGQEARVLLRLAQLREAAGDPKTAAALYDRIDSEHAASPQARDAAARLRQLAQYLPPAAPGERARRDLEKALGVFEVDRHREASVLLRGLLTRPLSPDDLDLVRVRLGQSLLSLRRYREGHAQLAAVRRGSPHEAEAAFHLARDAGRRLDRIDGYEKVASSYPGTPWGEEALLHLANHYQKDAFHEQAAPHWRRLLAGYPQGRWAERAAWRVGWADFRAGRYEECAQVLERVARSRRQTNATAGFLYWAGRARAELGQTDRARQLLEETVRRFKNAYHGIRAQEALAQLPPAGAPLSLPALVSLPKAVEGRPPLAARIRQLVLLNMLDEAHEELAAMPSSSAVQATIAWIETRRGRLRPAITAMKRAYPEYVGEAGDQLAEEVWRTLYPLEYGDVLQAKAADEGLDPALVAAIICQESTFDAGAVSRAGARGLMQVMGPTGRSLARALGVRYRKSSLHDPDTSLRFGTRYLRQMVDRFGGRVERALAAYNAGPHRVERWTAANPDMSAEEFIESIPFTETRLYVMTVLTNQVHYRRIYSLPAAPEEGGTRVGESSGS
jgi:soluble lytic murein transglycosylase